MPSVPIWVILRIVKRAIVRYRPQAAALTKWSAAALACALTLMLAGCSKGAKQPPAPPPTPAATNVSEAAPAGPDLAELNRQLRRWIVGNRRPPKNFEDFAANTTYQISPPPPGKKYVIDPKMHVLLVNR
jgi:hypothetical protein